MKKDMKENLQMVNLKEKENNIIVMGIFMKEIGVMIKKMDMENIF